jgi:monoamine oxidase
MATKNDRNLSVNDHGRISRRDILKRGAIFAAATTMPPMVARAQTSPLPKEILVLGAGMAGLTAALALLRRGHKVTVIEYQNRVGGRLLSLPLKDGQFTEAGGGHFRSNMPYVLSYINQFRLPVLALNDGLPRYLLDGKAANAVDLANWPWDLAGDERRVTLTSTLNRYLLAARLDTDTVLDVRWPDPETLAKLDNVTLGELLRGHGASNAFCNLLDVHAGMATTKEQSISVMPRLAYHFGDKNVFRISGGNDRLPRALAASIGRENFVLGAPVVAIDQTGPRVRVGVRDGREFTGDAVICTIPFSVLGDVEVRPNWSYEKLRMMREMEWANTVKVVVQTRTPSWLAKNVQGWPMAAGDRSWERAIDITGNERGGHGNVFFYINGHNAEALLKVPVRDRARTVLDAFRKDMPDYINDEITLESFAWPEQPWIKASFSSLPLGSGWMIREAASPDGRVHFAGDFTTLKFGWVEGAIESGLRAARQIDRDAGPEGRPRIRQEL